MKTIFLILALMFLGINIPYSAADEVRKTGVQKKFCPVCGPHTTEEQEELTLSYKHEGKKHYFCSMDCLKAFKKDPKKYLEGTAKV